MSDKELTEVSEAIKEGSSVTVSDEAIEQWKDMLKR